jgi:hypothetical protein
VTQQTTAALEEIAGALAKIENLTRVLAALNGWFSVLLDALDAASVEKTTRAAEGALASEAVDAA